jgi:3-phosphoshikimate 1-carboxyvinyltransferase
VTAEGGSPREIRPVTGPLRATVTVPGSKSLTNRALVIAALADGESRVSGALDCDDTRHMVGALERLGFSVAWDRHAAEVRVAGRGGDIPSSGAELYGGNAGTTVRFLTSLVALGRGRFPIDGDSRMRERPIGDLLSALAALGASVESIRRNDCPPVLVDAAGLEGGQARISGETSSQFTSSLLLVGPYARRGVVLTITGALVGEPFVDMTIALMRRAGVAVVRSGDEISVASGQRYRSGELAIEPDATAASYFLAAPMLVGGEVRVRGLGRESLQGDLAFTDVLRSIGASVRFDDDGVVVRGGELRGGDFDFRAISDTFLTAAALAPFASSPTRIRGIGHTRRQETDRVAAVARELARLGARVTETSDELAIEPSSLRGGDVNPHGDHRIAMSFALLGLKVPGIRIENPRCVDKTFPDFFERLESLGGNR